MKFPDITDDLSILISGEAGQGIQSIEQILCMAAKRKGHNVFAYSEFMSRIRGGNNSSEIRISSKRACAYLERIDVFVALSKNSTDRFENRISKNTMIIGSCETVHEKYRKRGYRFFEVFFSDILSKAGGERYLNVLVLGFLASLLKIDAGIVTDQICRIFKKNDRNENDKSINVMNIGHSMLKKHRSETPNILLKPDENIKKEIFINGSEAIGLGAIAGGCNFVASYPMSPSTGVLLFMAQNAGKFALAVEQSEDEIAAVNMVIGAWYAGARAMVTTSGGGFSLMTEGVSLAGCIETPAVIHVAQRPGPATGLPTRTEQGDLDLVLYAGHGEFARIILAPGSLDQGIRLSCRAFNMADKYQVPVFILTDQLFIDSSYNISEVDLSVLKCEKYFVKTDEKYRRYDFSAGGISPRGLPDYGRGLVCVDSDEHTENGQITENFDIRKRMVEKRINKLEIMEKEIIPPDLYGNPDYIYLLICWGSTLNTAREAVNLLERDDVALLHFQQVYPLHEKTAAYLQSAEKIIIIENNKASQFGRLISLKTGLDIDYSILKYDGMPFSVEEIMEKVRWFLQNGK